MADMLKKVSNFFRGGKLVHYKKGETIISRQSSAVPHLFYIKNGYVHQYSLFSDKQISINMYRPRSFFPNIHLFGNIPNTFTYATLTDASLFVVPRVKFLEFLEIHHEVSYDLIAKLSFDFATLVSIIESLTQPDSQSKIARTLLVYAKLLGVKRNKGVLINMPLTHSDIASMAGISRETATREMAYLVKQNLIKKSSNRYWIMNVPRLKKMLT